MNGFLKESQQFSAQIAPSENFRKDFAVPPAKLPPAGVNEWARLNAARIITPLNYYLVQMYCEYVAIHARMLTEFKEQEKNAVTCSAVKIGPNGGEFVSMKYAVMQKTAAHIAKMAAQLGLTKNEDSALIDEQADTFD